MKVLPGIFGACLLALAACGLPKDPEETLERVRGGELRVGVLPGNSEAEAADALMNAADWQTVRE